MITRKFYYGVIGLFLLLVPACSSQNGISESEFLEGISSLTNQTVRLPASNQTAAAVETVDFLTSLERIAEVERSGAFFQGLGMFESSLREDAGDLAGAAIAAYKELSWTYGYSGMLKAEFDERLRRLVEAMENTSNAEANTMAQGVLAFHNREWSRAVELLGASSPLYDEPDSFYQWMLLVCDLERGVDEYKTRSAYGAIRARYSKFPEYWYRGARAFKHELAALYAEQCINQNPGGPYAAECRVIIARAEGLDTGAESIRTTAEIEENIRRSVSEGDPQILDYLFPLMNLPDNKYTQYALGALKSLSSVPVYRDYFANQAARHTGRLGERLSYIARGL